MKALIYLGLLVCWLPILCTGDEPPVIPEGVRYKPATPENNEQAKQKLLKLFSGKATAEEVLAALEEKVVICGPGLWKELKDDPALAKMEGGDVTFEVPQLDANGKPIRMQKLEGKLFQDAERVTIFWKAFLQNVRLPDPKIRKLNTSELELFWAMISFDITEPVFIVESKQHKILVAFTSPEKLRICWMDDFQSLALRKDPAMNKPEGGAGG